jgi:ATP-binding cassette subfamily G (WHITE) protein 2
MVPERGSRVQGETTGTLLFGATTPTKTFLRRYTGYVEQVCGRAGDCM